MMSNNEYTNSKPLMKRDSIGRFDKGNQEGRKFQVGEGGRPKGSSNKKTVIARKFAEEVLYLNPETGGKFTPKELRLYIARKADESPRILNLLLDHYLGKPVDQVQQEQRVIVIRGEDTAQEQSFKPEGLEEQTEGVIVIRCDQSKLPDDEG